MQTRYDHIVVGLGSSGAVVAARVSEDPKLSVLGLEAGPDYPKLEELPEDLRNAYGVSVERHDWQYTAQVIPGRTIPYARAKVTGGCSAVNGSIALRGLPSDYDEWAAAGNTDWGWKDLLPYFKRIEDDPLDPRFTAREALSRSSGRRRRSSPRSRARSSMHASRTGSSRSSITTIRTLPAASVPSR